MNKNKAKITPIGEIQGLLELLPKKGMNQLFEADRYVPPAHAARKADIHQSNLPTAI